METTRALSQPPFVRLFFFHVFLFVFFSFLSFNSSTHPTKALLERIGIHSHIVLMLVTMDQRNTDPGSRGSFERSSERLMRHEEGGFCAALKIRLTSLESDFI